MTAGRDSVVYDSSSSCINLLVEIHNERITLSNCSIQRYSQTVRRINSTAGFTPQGCSLRTASTAPWWWTEQLKYDIVYFNCLAKALMLFIYIGETSKRTVSTDKTFFHSKAGQTPQDVFDINNCPCSYSLNEFFKLFQDISQKRSSNHHMFVDANAYNKKVLFSVDDRDFMLKILHKRWICNGPCISFSLSTQSSIFPEARVNYRTISLSQKKLASPLHFQRRKLPLFFQNYDW